jgi:hypothetical protein
VGCEQPLNVQANHVAGTEVTRNARKISVGKPEEKNYLRDVDVVGGC